MPSPLRTTCAVPVLPAMGMPGTLARAPVPSFTTPSMAWRTKARVSGLMGTWRIASGSYSSRTSPERAAIFFTTHGRWIVPPLAMAETMTKSCMGEVTTSPWPMLVMTVLPADQPGWPRRLGCGLGRFPRASSPSPSPGGSPRPKARETRTISSMPTFRPGAPASRFRQLSTSAGSAAR